MKTTKIEITGYRSINNLEIEIDEISNKTCYILIGRNETGKSNILKAISLKNDASDFDYTIDCNKELRKEDKPIEIKLQLSYSDEEISNILTSIDNIPKPILDAVEFTTIYNRITIDNSNEKEIDIWTLLADRQIFSDYVINSSTKEFELISSLVDSSDKVNEENINEILGEGYKMLNSSNVSYRFDDILTEKQIPTPEIIYWEPSQKYLINDPISIESFKADVNTSIPLKNIFRISGIDNVSNRLGKIESYEDRAQLEKELTEGITNYINSVWPEHQINIVIRIEEGFCQVMVEDKDNDIPKYQMSQRSEGFKQFISILLNLSIENETDEIKNKIILLDEPEVHMHPSGIRYLRDELLNISKNNIVIIATHSIYMVDKLNLSRHIKVDKENSITTIKPIEVNNPYEEELIYESLGTSIYELIEPNMIVFEGKTDKDLFDAFTKKFSRDIKPIRVGTISADGVNKIPQYVKFFNGKFVKGFVLVDSDIEGQRIKDKIKKEFKQFNSNNTLEINDITKASIPSTLEDLFPNDIIKDLILKNFDVAIDINSDEAVLSQIVKMNKISDKKVNIESLKTEIVNYILNDISRLNRRDTIEKYSSYYNFIVKFHSHLKEI